MTPRPGLTFHAATVWIFYVPALWLSTLKKSNLHTTKVCPRLCKTSCRSIFLDIGAAGSLEADYAPKTWLHILVTDFSSVQTHSVIQLSVHTILKWVYFLWFRWVFCVFMFVFTCLCFICLFVCVRFWMRSYYFLPLISSKRSPIRCIYLV